MSDFARVDWMLADNLAELADSFARVEMSYRRLRYRRPVEPGTMPKSHQCGLGCVKSDADDLRARARELSNQAKMLASRIEDEFERLAEAKLEIGKMG